ncbi:TetR/AcrR family transcriptional regulator [Lacrimispora defluvii]|uniref:TetR/AcrR family transcriptional regulator n=1 Tax=Lacrimispora defluvii TaxID=2719233 RepID=A0ABX1VUD3_9FIRM|nr:TetR/AcrR family transcriptional regulator [Lacrimispora defluvii]NNJ30831.1 TetR/AcrR family transcriptional regulator [Lacrimispora defluvii]
MARTAENYPVKRIELLKIAEQVFMTKGYNETNISDILEVAGISKGAFYHYFKSKEELLEASIDSLMDDAIDFLMPAVENSKLSAMDKFEKFMRDKTVFQSSKKEYAVLLGKLMQADVFQYKYVLKSSTRLVPLLARIIEQGINEGDFKVSYPLETAEIIIRTVNSIPNSNYYDEYISNSERQKKYVKALQEVIGGTLGIDPEKVII